MCASTILLRKEQEIHIAVRSGVSSGVATCEGDTGEPGGVKLALDLSQKAMWEIRWHRVCNVGQQVQQWQVLADVRRRPPTPTPLGPTLP